jgi:dihydroorotate dehydrogenase electron transfer subunit
MSRDQVLARLLEPRLKLATVSGVLTTRADLIDWVDRHIPEIELITTKSYQVRANPGNREPILVEPEPGSYGNAVGLSNPGMEEGFRELAALRRTRPLRCLLAVSLSADCVEDFIRLTHRFAPVADLLELNFSCPHARDGYGAAIGSSAETVAAFVGAIRRATRAPLFPKLTPNVPDIGAIARAAVAAGADGIAAINTVGPEVFREPFTGLPVLHNPNGHKGGKSGLWIRETAREKIAEIRRAVGPGVAILGMGGVSSGRDALRLQEAGANTVGLGSLFARVQRQKLFPALVSALAVDAAHGTETASVFLNPGSRMAYRQFRIAEAREVHEGLKLFRLEGSLEAQAGEFAFLFLPGVGEKPFSLARQDPLTFLVRLRGEFTSALFRLKPGDPLLVRGTYGAPAPVSSRPQAFLVAGGTGLAVVPELASALRAQGKRVELFYGVKDPREVKALEELRAAIGEAVPCVCVPDRGRPGRVLDELLARLAEADPQESCFYNLGPHPLLESAMELEERFGCAPQEIFACLETLTMCGVGLCGGCSCGGRLLCKEGTFVSLQYLRSAGLRLTSLEPPHPRWRDRPHPRRPASASRGLSTGGQPVTPGPRRGVTPSGERR